MAALPAQRALYTSRRSTFPRSTMYGNKERAPGTLFQTLNHFAAQFQKSQTSKSGASKYYSRQGDDDFQRHEAYRHHREGYRQDRFGQQSTSTKLGMLFERGGQRYIADCVTIGATGQMYRLRGVTPGTLEDGRWVSEAEIEQCFTCVG